MPGICRTSTIPVSIVPARRFVLAQEEVPFAGGMPDAGFAERGEAGGAGMVRDLPSRDESERARRPAEARRRASFAESPPRRTRRALLCGMFLEERPLFRCRPYPAVSRERPT